MKKGKRKKNNLHDELAELNLLVGEQLPRPGEGIDLRPGPGEDPFIRKLMDEERALLNPEEWGIDLRPIFREQLGPLPPDKELSDRDLSGYLRWMVLILAQHHLCLTNTNHLSDRELYRFILEEIIPQPLGISGNPQGTLLYHECCPCDSEEYQIYYGDEDSRNEWRECYGEELAEKQPLVSDRDLWLETLAEAHRDKPLP